MRKAIKPVILVFFLLTGISRMAYAQITDIIDLQKSLISFSDDFAKSLPFNASLGLNWSDAYIGKFFPSLLPHFGVGNSIGFTSAKLPAVKTLAKYLGYTIPNEADTLIFPAYIVEGRLGGIFYPIDMGIKFGFMPYNKFPNNKVSIYSLLAGADVRYALLDGKTNILVPNVSLGFGINYMKGGLEGSAQTSQTINFGIGSIKLENPGVAIDWDCFSLDFKAQISKSFILLTPYMGIGASYAFASASYSVNANVTANGSTIDQSYINMINFLLDNLGLGNIGISQSGISSTRKNSDFNYRIFGGCSFNLLVLKLDLTGLYSIVDSNYGFSLGVRFQI